METSYIHCSEPEGGKKWHERRKKWEGGEECHLFWLIPLISGWSLIICSAHESVALPRLYSSLTSWPFNFSSAQQPLALPQSRNPLCKHANSTLMVLNSTDRSASLIMERLILAEGWTDVGTIRSGFQLDVLPQRRCLDGKIMQHLIMRQILSLWHWKSDLIPFRLVAPKLPAGWKLV